MMTDTYRYNSDKHAKPTTTKRQQISLTEKGPTFLPDDMIREILSRSPVKSLIRFSCVSKFYRNFIMCDRSFTYAHLSRSPRLVDVEVLLPKTISIPNEQHESLIATLNLKNKSFSNPLYLDQHKYYFSFVGSCNGIICFLSGFPETKVYVWNPSLHQIRDLRTIMFSLEFLGFGYDYQNKQHKFVRISSGLSSEVEIYSLEKDSWKSFNHDLLPDINIEGLFLPDKALELNGSLHWISSKFCILIFGLSEEKVREFPLPGAVDISNVSLGVVKGCLSVSTCGIDTRTIWSMMNANDNGTWSKTFEFTYPHELSTKIGNKKGRFGHRQSGQLTANGKITAKDGLYDPETKTWKQYSGTNPYQFSHQFIDYTESLISVNQSARS